MIKDSFRVESSGCLRASSGSYVGRIFASEEIDFDMPQKLFAQKPQSLIGKFVWDILGRFNFSKPRDECEFKKRFIVWCIPLAVILSARFLIRVLMRMVTVIYFSLGCLTVLFFGWRPVPFLPGIKKILLSRKVAKEDLRLNRFFIRRKWKSHWDDYDRDDKRDKYIPFALSDISLIVFVLLMVFSPQAREVWPHKDSPANLLFSILILIVFLIFMIRPVVGLGYILCYVMNKVAESAWLSWMSEFFNERREKKEKRAVLRKNKKAEKEEQKDEQRRQKRIARVRAYEEQLKHVAPGVSRNPIKVLHVSFWALKAKVCRPYDRKKT